MDENKTVSQVTEIDYASTIKIKDDLIGQLKSQVTDLNTKLASLQAVNTNQEIELNKAKSMLDANTKMATNLVDDNLSDAQLAEILGGQ